MRFAKLSVDLEPNWVDEKADRHAGRRGTACDLALGVRFQQRVPIECVEIYAYISWIRRTAKLQAFRKLLFSIRTFRC